MPLTQADMNKAPIGTQFKVGNTTYMVTGHKPSRPKFTFTGSGPQGGRYKFTTEQVINGLLMTTNTTNTTNTTTANTTTNTSNSTNSDSNHAEKRQKTNTFDDVETLFLAQDIYEIVAHYMNGTGVVKPKLAECIAKRVAERDYYVNRST